MKIETILNAMERARFKAAQIKGYKKHDLQYRAFRARILKMFEEKDKQLAILEEDKWNLKDEIRVKDARIAALEDKVHYLRRELDEQKRVWERRQDDSPNN